MAESKSSKHFSKSEAINFGFETAKKNLFFYFALFVICAFLILSYVILQAILVSNFGVLGSFITGVVNWVVTASITLGFVNDIIVDKKMGIDSLSKSWQMTKGVKLNLFLFWILLALINIAGALLLLVGLFITVPLSMVATAYVYRKLVS